MQYYLICIEDQEQEIEMIVVINLGAAYAATRPNWICNRRILTDY